MKINEEKLKQYIADEEIEVFETENDFLEFVNTERSMFWAYEYPNNFETFEETKQLGGEYLLHHNGKYYWISYDHCLDIYK